MSQDGISPEDQAEISKVARGVMQQLAAGRSAEDVAHELQTNGWKKATADALVEQVLHDWRQVEASPQANAALYLQMKYPEMRPVGSAPMLYSINTIGTGFYGSRDLDRPTGTFVKTQCFCILLIPLIALKSYRVSSRGAGWTLVGRVPLSRFAKTWNVMLLCGILAAIGVGVVSAYLESPTYVASRTLARADEAAAAGKLLEASRLYRKVADSRTEYAATASNQCCKLLERPEIDSLALREVIEIFDEVLQARPAADNAAAVSARGLALVKSRVPTDPTAAIELLGRVARLSSPEACKTFAELMQGPLAALPPAETVSIFGAATAIPQDDDQKTAMVGIGVTQCRRLAATDLPAAMALLAILAPFGDRLAVDQCLADLLGPPLDKAPCAEVAKVLQAAKTVAGPEGEKKLSQVGIAWVEHHPQAAQREVFDLLDQLADLHEADTAAIASIRRPLLEKLVAANPQDADLAVQLALALEGESRSQGGKTGSGNDPNAAIVKLLAPHREQLGTGEGARLLGQALAAEGKFDDSYALLEPYLDKRLDAFHEAEQAYTDAIKQVTDRVRQEFQNGTAPGFDFNRANGAAEEQQHAMAMEYLNQQIKEDPGVDAARERLANQGMVVPAALDLGMVTLQRAQAMKDPAARRTELERAEKTFLAIRGMAGESDQYMLHLGQVYYWLGKQVEGQQEFDKLLEKHQRKAEILYSLASVLRDLGASAEARKLMEEAYDKSPDQKEKQDIAHLRAITSTSLEDKIHWLELCDTSSFHVKALLAEARGSQAEADGKDEEAASLYREAAALYEQQPQDVSVLNNGSLAYLALFEVSGDRQALERGTQWLEKAVSLSPMDAVILTNAAHVLLRAALQDLAGTKLNLRELQMSENIDVLYFLVSDQKSLDDFRRQAREHVGLRKALNYLDKAKVLSPKNLDINASALSIYSYLRDRDALQRLARQVVANKPDVSESTAKTLKFFRYDDEEFSKEKMRAKIARATALVKRLGIGDKGPTYAAAVDGLIDLKMALADDESIDFEEIVRLAEGAHGAAASMATYGTLIQALMSKAGRKLAADYPEYAQATHGTARAASARDVLALVLARNDALGKSARENKDVQRAIALAAARIEVFPESRGLWAWAVLGAAEPNRADLRAKCLVPDELDEVEREIGHVLAVVNPHEAFETYWRRRAAGEANAREPLDHLAELGVPLPLGLIQDEAERK